MKATVISVEGIVALRDTEPYIVLYADGERIAQLSVAEARNIARDIERMCSRTEADAMIHRFFTREGFPAAAGSALMLEFRNFRSRLDAQAVEKTESEPRGEEPV